LNNGITILASKANNAGHLRLSLEDPQIVNGLQTSREVFSYFTDKKPSAEERAILIRVIETQDAEVRDFVIKATNSQNRMPQASLRMTDPIHRKLEDLLKQFDLYYDRRRGYYRDQRKPIRKILGVTALAQALISVLLQRPDDARARPGDYFKDDDAYNSIFGEDVYPLPVHVGCVRLLRVVEAFIDNEDIDRGDAKNIKFYVLWLLSVMLAQDIAPTTTLHLLRDPETIDPQMIKACFKLAVKRYEQLAVHSDRDIVAKGPELLKALRTDIKRRLPKKKQKKGAPKKSSQKRR
jgi:hypothetical protein